MLETCFSTAPDVTTIARAIAALVRPSAIRSRTSRSRGVSAASAAFALLPRARAHELGHHLAIERRPAPRHALHGIDEAAHVADALLEQVADAALAGLQQLGGVDRLDVLREHEDAEPRLAHARLQGRAQALVGEARRQAHVDDRQVGLVAGDDAQQARRRPRPGRRRRCPARAGARRSPRAAAPGPRRSPPAWQLRAHGRPAAGGAGDRQGAVERGDAMAQAHQPGAGRVGAARAVVAHLDDQPVAVVGELDAWPPRRRRAWRRWSAPRPPRSRRRSR